MFGGFDPTLVHVDAAPPIFKKSSFSCPYDKYLCTRQKCGAFLAFSAEMLSSGLAQKSHSAHSAFVQGDASPLGTGGACCRERTASAGRLGDLAAAGELVLGFIKGLVAQATCGSHSDCCHWWCREPLSRFTDK